MTPANRRRAGVLPWHGVWRQSAVDAAPLLVGVVVVAVAAFLSCAVPQTLDAAATSEVRAALSTREPITVVVEVPDDIGNGPDLDPAGSAASIGELIDARMPAELRSVLAEPVTALIGPELKAGSIADRPGRARFAYVSSATGPAVEWVEGRAPAATEGSVRLPPPDGEPVIVEVAMSEAAAALMGVHAGAKLEVDNINNGQLLVVRLSGVYRVTNPADPAWGVEPTLLKPQLIGGSAALASVGLLTSAESLTFADFALYPTGMTRTYTYTVVPGGVDARLAAEVATQARGLASGRKVFDIPGARPTVRTQLDRVVGSALARVDAATAQASVLLIGLLAVALLVELLAAGLLVERRAAVLAQWRARGATLPSIGLANAAESSLLAVVGGLIGVAAANLLVGGLPPWGWILPPLVAASLPQPILAMRAASRSSVVRRPASGQRTALTAAQVRRVGAEVMLVLLALATLATLVVRGVTASAGSVWSDTVVLAAPVLVALAVALGLVRAWPGVLRVARTGASRGTGAVRLLAAARTRASGLATAAIVTGAAIAAIAASVAGTVSQGQVDAAWDAIGADATVTTTAPGGLPPAVTALDGVRGTTVASGTTITNAQVLGSRLDAAVTVVAVDADAMARLLAASPAPDAPQLASLTAGGAGDPVPVLFTGGQGAESATLRWGEDAVRIRPVGDATALPASVTGEGPVVVVDRELLGRAAGHPIPATEAWVVGESAAADLVAAVEGDYDTTVATRGDWLTQRTNSPVTLALGFLFAGASTVAIALAGLAVVLMAASGSWERTRAAAQIKVLGLPRAAAARIGWLEATIPAVVASGVGIVVGIGLAGLLVGALDLRSVTGGSGTPRLVIGWWSLGVPLILGLVARVAVAAVGLAHRGERLGPLLRAG